MGKRKTFWWWVAFILLCIWQLPQFIVGLLMFPFMRNRELIADRHFNFCWKSPKMSGGISLGPIAFVSERSSDKESVAHETDGHTWQSKLLGPLYLFIIGIPSIMWAWLYNYKKHCYYDFYTESWCNKIAGLEADEHCRLHFKA